MVEGEKLLMEALAAGARVQSVFAGPGTGGAVLDQARAAGAALYQLAPGLVERVASTVTPQSVLGIVDVLDVDLAVLRGAGLAVACVSVRDPGNAGTVLRSAEAAGADGVVFCGDSVDVYNPKTVRASAGSLLHVPVVVSGDPWDVLERLGSFGMRRIGTVTHGGRDHSDADLTGPVAIVLGNEAAGLPEGLGSVIDEWVSIPMAGRAESLNVGMAAAVLCFEAARQRRSDKDPSP